MCDHATPYDDRCNSDGTSQAGRISNHRAGHRNDKITDVILVPYNELENPAGMLFTDGGCSGSSMAYIAGPPGTVSLPGLGFIGNDMASGVKIPFNVIIQVFADGGWRGGENTFDFDRYRHDVDKVRKFGEEPYCFDLHSTGMGDRTSGVKITHKKIGAARGTWKNIGTSFSDLPFYIYWGISSQLSTDAPATMMNYLTMAMHEGILFEDSGYTKYPSNDKVIKATKDAFSQWGTNIKSKKYKAYCDIPKANKKIPVEWRQWVTTATTKQAKIFADTKLFACFQIVVLPVKLKD